MKRFSSDNGKGHKSYIRSENPCRSKYVYTSRAKVFKRYFSEQREAVHEPCRAQLMYHQDSSDEARPEHKPCSLFKDKEACGHPAKSGKSSGKHWSEKAGLLLWEVRAEFGRGEV
ncbi:hypothetical protein KOW79_016139 [Hemibagrus wyckioides]|uniref:Uncharacterized protein n=1 Tax=Hemibagrus wyckioides TaxID=337641 RepID=A0A9D3SDD9_9TELE|nr:hypothetical protein KOW79_016139 [Hemibagrus wyckioides]